MPASPAPIIYRSETQPAWGRGIVAEESGDKVVVIFEHEAAPKTFKKAMLSKGLTPVEISASDALSLEEKLRGKRRPAVLTSAEKKKRDEKKAKTSAAKRATALYPTFAAQVAAFEKAFPGGFTDDAFVSGERGVEGGTAKTGLKQGAIAFVKENLSADAFEKKTPQELFDAAKKAIAATNIAFPVEGHIPFGKIAEEDRAPLLAALKDLLHGSGDYAPRFEAFIKTVNLKDNKGAAKAVTWPLATLLPALFAPKEHVAVKPTAFASQAAMLGQDIQKSEPLNGKNYERFLSLARRTQELLTEAGHKPRDLMDVYSFIWRTHAEKPEKAPKEPKKAKA